MALEGHIEDFPLSEIVQLIGMGRKTGQLIINGETEQIQIHFKDGFAVFAHPSFQKDRLGNILVKDGVVKREDIYEALETQKKSLKKGKKQRIGTALVTLGKLSEDELKVFIEAEIRDSIQRVLSEKTGSFEFVSEYELLEDDVTVSLNVEEVILEGMRRIDEWTEIKNVITSFNTVFAIVNHGEIEESVNLSINEWKIFSLINGDRTVNDILSVSRLDSFDVSKIVYNLLNAGIIEKISVKKTKRRKVERIKQNKPKFGVLNRVLSRIRGL